MVMSRPGTTTRRDPKRSINTPKNGERMAVIVTAMDGPDDKTVRVQPKSFVSGSMKRPIAASIMEKKEKPIEAARTSIHPLFYSAAEDDVISLTSLSGRRLPYR